MGGAGWGGMEMQDAEIGTELREGEGRGGETEIMKGPTAAQERGTDE